MTSRNKRLLRLLNSPQIRRHRLNNTIILLERKAELRSGSSMFAQVVRVRVPRDTNGDGVVHPWLGVDDRFREDGETVDGAGDGTEDRGDRFFS